MSLDHYLQTYEPVMGLEIHLQLKTASKAFSADSTLYGALPNEHTSPVTLGLPGCLPVFNRRVIDHAIRLGLACESTIHPYNEFARKNYFYADLPKGYQISQFLTPICTGGQVHIHPKGEDKATIGLIRIHMEEDSGKSIHDLDPYDSLIDLNRAGTPLLEIVSEPHFRTFGQVYSYLFEMRKLVRYLEVSDGNMEEGSLRCDANISVRRRGETQFNTRVEVKNINSMTNVKKAMQYEFERQCRCYETGEEVQQQTRGWNALESKTTVMRSKEDAHDYRYFPEPDLPPVYVDEKEVDEVRKAMPPLPQALYDKYTQELGLSDYDASNITADKEIALYYEELLKHSVQAKAAANWLMGSIKSYLNEKSISIQTFPIRPQKIVDIITLIEDDKISNSVATQRLFPAMIEQPTANVLTLAEDLNLIQDSDEDTLATIVDEVLASHPDKVEAYRSGKKGLLGMFMGEVMKKSKGKASPKVANELVRRKLE